MSDSRESRRKTLEANRATLAEAEKVLLERFPNATFTTALRPESVEAEVTVQDSPPRPILAETGEKV